MRSSQFWGTQPCQRVEREYANYARWHEEQGRGEPPEHVRALLLREVNEFDGNDFSGADLLKVDFRGGIDLSRQRLPCGDDYLYLPDAAATIERALTLLPDQVPAELAERVTFFLRGVLGREIDMGQPQLFLRKQDFERKRQVPSDVLAAFDLLRGAEG